MNMDNLRQIVKKKTPIWFMRQAGRYLPEYRKIRKKEKNFLDLCFNSSLAAEISLQPIKRFNFDFIILFSDILVIPFALGQKVEFKESIGPILNKIEFSSADGSSDPGLIAHQSRGTTDDNIGILHLCPSDDSVFGDYVFIHGYNEALGLKILPSTASGTTLTLFGSAPCSIVHCFCHSDATHNWSNLFQSLKKFSSILVDSQTK